MYIDVALSRLADRDNFKWLQACQEVIEDYHDTGNSFWGIEGEIFT